MRGQGAVEIQPVIGIAHLGDMPVQLALERRPVQRLGQLAYIQRLQGEAEIELHATFAVGRPQVQVFEMQPSTQHRHGDRLAEPDVAATAVQRQVRLAEFQTLQRTAAPVQRTADRSRGRIHRLAAEAFEAETLLCIHQRDFIQLRLGSGHFTVLQNQMRGQRTLQLQLAQTEQTQPAGQVTWTQRSDVAAVQGDIGITQAGIGSKAQAAFHTHGIAVIPGELGDFPTPGALLARGQVQCDRRGGQGEIGVACQYFATLQLAIHGDQRQAGRLAEIQIEAASDAFGGGRAIGGIQGQLRDPQASGHTQWPPVGSLNVQASPQKPAFQVGRRPGLRQQCLRPGHGHAD